MTKQINSKPVLVPVDFSPHSAAALACAAELAETLGSNLVILHVVHDPGDAPGYYAVKGRNKQLRRMEDVAADMLKEFIQTMKDKNTGLPALNFIRYVSGDCGNDSAVSCATWPAGVSMRQPCVFAPVG